MRITKFWAKGYRSLRDVTLDDLGAFNVFYGPNGSGKSNILSAIRALFDLLEAIAWSGVRQLLSFEREGEAWRASSLEAGKVMLERSSLRGRDVFVGAPSRVVTLGAVCEASREPAAAPELALGAARFHRIEVEVTVDWNFELAPRLGITSLVFDDIAASRRDVLHGERYNELLALLGSTLPRAAFSLIDANRAPRDEAVTTPPGEGDAVAWHLRNGNLKRALFAASTSPDVATRNRLKRYRAILAGPPLRRPSFDVVQDTRDGHVDVRETLGDGDVSLDLAGLGVAQVYAILAGVLLSDARAVGVEEPEAHLHAPTTGRDLRELLGRVVREGLLDQLFVATHSNLFDLDPAGYWDVSLDATTRETRVVRKALDEIDAGHLYEPGPAKHALLRALAYLSPGEVVFRPLAGGEPVTAEAMCELLRRDAPEADDFLRAVYGSAVRSVRRLAQTAAPAKERLA